MNPWADWEMFNEGQRVGITCNDAETGAHFDVFLVERVELVGTSRVQDFELNGGGCVRVDLVFLCTEQGARTE